MVIGNVVQTPKNVFELSLPAARAYRQQLRRDDVHSDVRCRLNVGRPHFVCHRLAVQHRVALRHLQNRNPMKPLKYIEEDIVKAVMLVVTVCISVVLLIIIGTICWRGIPSLSWEMLTQIPKGGFYLGKEGGILNAIVGSFYVAFGASILAFFISLPVALFMNLYMIRYQRLLIGFRFLLDALWGIPSIVYGAFGFVVMMYFGLRSSLLAGIVTVTLAHCAHHDFGDG